MAAVATASAAHVTHGLVNAASSVTVVIVTSLIVYVRRQGHIVVVIEVASADRRTGRISLVRYRRRAIVVVGKA